MLYPIERGLASSANLAIPHQFVGCSGNLFYLNHIFFPTTSYITNTLLYIKSLEVFTELSAHSIFAASMSEAGVSPSRLLTKVHNYLVGAMIAKGSFSTVRPCFKKGSSKAYIMKIIQTRRLSESRGGRSVLFNEKCLMPLLNHPNILHVAEVIEAPRQLFIVSRLCKQGDLLAYLSKHSLDNQTSLRLIDEVLAAVEYLHSRNICHRDIKLENVLVDKSSHVCLGDLGLASITFTGSVSGKRGSLAYMAPEARSGEHFDGFKADVFSCGVMFYSILTQTMAFDETLQRFEPDFDLIPNDPMRILIQQMLSNDPNDRPTITECRQFPVFDTLEDRIPLAPKPLPFSDIDEHIVSKLSQILDTPAQKLLKKLGKSDMNREKLMYSLFLEKMGRLSIESDHFEEISASRSCPRTFGTPIMTEQFVTSSIEVMKAMKGFLKPVNGCVTAANADNTSQFIVVNHTDSDEVIEFELTDLQQSKALLSIASSNSRTLVNGMMEFIRNKLTDMPVPVLA